MPPHVERRPLSRGVLFDPTKMTAAPEMSLVETVSVFH